MSFLNAAILFGVALTAIPVILHLLLKNKPKKLLFPALRLLQLRKKVNSRRLRLKHLWLLLLRVLLILLIVLALSRPSLPPADYAFSAREWWTLAGLAIVSLTVYIGLEMWWKKKQRLSAQHLRDRRTFLRGAVGTGALILFLLLVLMPYGSRIVAQWKDPQPLVQENFPVSAVLIFDVSPSMSYRQDNLDRVELSRQYAEELISRIPAGSQLSVTHNASDDPPIFLSESSVALDRLSQLQIVERARTLDQRVRAAINLQIRDRERTLEAMGLNADNPEADRYLREIYLFTDLSRHAWSNSGARSILQLMEENPWLAVYLVDVSVGGPQNVMVGVPRLSGQTLSHGEPLSMQVDLVSNGIVQDQQTLELYVAGPTGKLVKHDQRTVSVNEQGGAKVNFNYQAAQKTGAINGELRLVASDPLLFDNRRYFSVDVVPPPRVLFVSDEKARAELWMTMLAPETLQKQGKARYQTDWQPTSALSRLDYSQFDLVCLLSASEPNSEAWSQLEEFVSRGGGLLIALGTKEIDPVAYQESLSAREVMPGTPTAFLKFTPPEFLDFSRREHPILSRFDEFGGVGFLLDSPVHYRWRVTPHPDARTIMPYTNAEAGPALLEKSLGKGRVLLLTTSISPGEWNELARAPLEFMILSDFMLKYLNQQRNRRLNYSVGESAIFPLPTEDQLGELLFTDPQQEQIRFPLESGTTEIPLGPFQQAGRYRLAAREADFRSAFSVNLPESESDLTVMEQTDLEDFFGEGRFGIARSLEELEPVIRNRRLGQEMVPLLLLLAAIVFGLEQITANRFYDEEQSAEAKNAELATS